MNSPLSFRTVASAGCGKSLFVASRATKRPAFSRQPATTIASRLRFFLSLLTLGGAIACAAPSCTGTETDNPVIHFEHSGCNLHMAEAALIGEHAPWSADAPRPISDYAGLFCFAWTAHDGGRLDVHVYNMDGGCSIDWEGRAQREGDRLQLIVAPAGCASAGCLRYCEYDLAFELDGVDASRPLALELHRQSCDEPLDAPEATLTLPLDEQKSGSLCRLPPSRAGYFPERCGQLHYPPCQLRGNGVEPFPCASGEERICDAELRCDGSLDGGLCAMPCSADDECVRDLERCEDGTCRLRKTF
jgi:hypothetical protein